MLHAQKKHIPTSCLEDIPDLSWISFFDVQRMSLQYTMHSTLSLIPRLLPEPGRSQTKVIQNTDLPLLKAGEYARHRGPWKR